MSDVIVLGTLDTKGREYRYLCRVLESLGLSPIIVDVSLLDREHGYEADHTCDELAHRAGVEFEQIRRKDRKGAAELMSRGAKEVVGELVEEGAAGIIALGGNNGTFLACEVMKTLPLGFPKVMISVVPAGDPRENVGTDDIILFNTITDTYLNSILKTVMKNACASLMGMITHSPSVERVSETNSRNACVSVLGLVEPCLNNIRDDLADDNWELMVFHANGIGGRGLEDATSSHDAEGVLELAVNELMNTIVGGVFDAGEERMEAAIRNEVPMVVVPGCIDFVNFWGENIPEEHEDRTFIHYSAQNTLMRTNADENARLARRLADKLNRVKTNAAVVIPARGFSGMDSQDDGGTGSKQGEDVPWHDPDANAAFIETLQSSVENNLVTIRVHDHHINDVAFSSRILREFRDVTGVSPRD
jgi:uncharacterized protein (UPF0261 family)